LLEGFCTTQVDKSQTKNFARKDVHGTDFRSDSSAFLFKYDRVIFYASKLAGAVHEGSDLLNGGIVLEDAVDIERDDLFQRVAGTPT
jgi:hypothetical protein